MATTFREDPKQAAIELWTADPCGVIDGELGTRGYFARLLDSRDSYVLAGWNGPWHAEFLDYEGASGLKVLDVGCGQGIDLYRYATAGAEVTGIDLVPRHVELARAHLTEMGMSAEVLTADAEALPFEDATFDRVLSNSALQYTPDMPAALREIKRVLRPGGRATIIVYNRNSAYFWLAKVLHGGLIKRRLFHVTLSDHLADMAQSSAKPLVRMYSRRQLRTMMRAAGFREVQIATRHSPDGTFILWRLRNALLHRTIGRYAGWYLIAVASS
jgi:ubiquinone/menaquinone biosynthesis C-methylase UbiE